MNDALQIIARLLALTFIVSSMLAAGLGLTPRAIVAPLKNARLVVLALLINLVLAPALALLLTSAVPLERPYVVGLLLLSVAAGAPFLPTLTEVARGDTAFSVALMALLTAATLIVMPLALPLLIPGMQASPWRIARPLLVFIVLPLIAGMLLRTYVGSLSGRFRPVAAAIANVSVFLLLVLVIARHFDALVGVVGSGAIAVAAVFIAVLLAAGYLAGGSQPQIKSVLGLGSAARNIGAALPAASDQSDPKVMVMLLVATLVGVLLALLAAGWMRRRTPVMTACNAGG